MVYPFKSSYMPYTGLLELHYTFRHMTITLTQCGRHCFSGRKINLSQVFGGEYFDARDR